MTWIGWYRLREGLPWRRACQGETLAECSRRLNAATRQLGIKDVNAIMTGGAYPRIPPYPPPMPTDAAPAAGTPP